MMIIRQGTGLLLIVGLFCANLHSQTPPREHRLDESAIPLVAPTGVLPRDEQLTSFDAGSVRLDRRDGHYVLLKGESILKNCGTREEEAHQVWRLIRQLGLTQRGVIGVKQPIMEYWLAGNQPLQGLPRGVRVMPINHADLRLEKSQGFWVLRETSRVLFNFGTEEQEAKQALAVIRKYGFNRVGVIGQAIPAMLLFASSPEGVGSRSISTRKDSLTQTGAQMKEPPGAVKSIAASPSFYPTPIVPPLIERGRPSRNASAPNTEALPEVAALGSSSDRIGFDYRLAQVKRENTEWMLTVGGQTLARFGTSEHHARQAHSAIQHYRLTEMHRIGSEANGARYFLSTGQAPRGIMLGVIGESFQPERLTIRQYGDRHFLVIAGRPIIDAGSMLEEAQQFLAVVRQHRFDHICRIGPTDKESLMLLVRSY